MSKTRRLPPLALVLLVLLGNPWLARAADGPGEPPKTVVEVRVRGNDRVSAETVLAQVRTRVGQPYDEQVLIDDQARLVQTGQFAAVLAEKALTDKGYVVTFIVTEHPRIRELVLRGNKFYKNAKLRKEIGLAAGDPLGPSRVEMGRRKIEEMYQKDGFYFAKVTVDRQAMELRQQVVYEIVEGPRIRVNKVRFVFEGPRSYGNLKLKGQIKTSQALWFLSRGKLDDEQLARDVVGLRNFYRDEGFFDAQVASDLKFSADRKRIEVRFLVNEGPRYRVQEVRFEGNTVYADRELLDRLKMTTGAYHTTLQLTRDTEALRDAYGQIGHIEAVVEPRTVFVAPEGGAEVPSAPETRPAEAEGRAPRPAGGPAVVNVVYTITESDQYRVGRVTIRGNSVTEDRVIRRQLRFFPEQLLDTVAVKESRQRLMESQLFSNVTITPYGNAPSVRDALVAVQEMDTASFSVGVGYSTNSGVLGSIALTQRNFSWTALPDSWGQFFRGRSFKGAGQIFRINIEPGTEMVRARVDWREPFLFDKPLSLGAGAYYFTRGREDYDESRIGVQSSLGKLFKNQWYAEMAVRLEDVRLDNLDDDAPPEAVRDEGDHVLLGFKGTLVRDRTDSRWMPSKGDRLSLSLEQVVGTDVFTQADAAYTRYYTTYVDALDRKHILALRGQFDSNIAGDAPIFEKFYAGGIGSVRGFEYRGISPRSAGTNKPIGGDMMAYLGSEYTFPLVAENLRGVLFLDTGTVEEDYSVTTWRASAGFGVRLHLPFFGPVPMSLDFGFPLNKNSQDDTQLLSFTFGWVF